MCTGRCGDLPYYYLEFLVTSLAVPCYYILGNHDTPEQTDHGEVINEPRGYKSLEGRSIRFGGLIMAGLGGCLRYNQSQGAQYTETEMLFHYGASLRAWCSTACAMGASSISC